ncbi:MAG: hypothetical protein L3J02_04805, partial [Henriciella sp.]|nr:hypothetical protein [Henriciella sp.]
MPAELQLLDQRFRELSNELYQDYIGPDGGGNEAISGPMLLQTLGGPLRLEIDVRGYLEEGNEIRAIATIIQNKELVLKKVRRNTVGDFIQLLLDHNEWLMAN